MSTGRDNAHSLAGLYGLSGNALAAWLLARGRGEVLALTPAEIQTPMTPPCCPDPKCNTRAMNYRGDYWACYLHAEPVKVRIDPLRGQETPSLIDWGEGDGPERFEDFSVEDLVRLAEREVDVVYKSDGDGRPPSWRYVVRS